ncbi:MAG: isopeptide-forming domain-containing fimbrial protein [bacterium]|nr:isopeptide-forming domain-containing fimbrial protein [bacterium]
MKNFAKILIAIVIFSFTFAGVSFAKEICTTQYGGGQTCVNVDEDSTLTIDKTIYNPDHKKYEDHVQSDSYVFTAGEEIKFKISVENTGKVTYKKLVITDELPDFVEFVKFTGDDTGSISDNKRQLTWGFSNFKPGDEVTVEFTAKVVKESLLPDSSGDMQTTNITRVEGIRKDNNEKDTNADYSRFYIRLPRVKGAVTQLPEAGPTSWVFALGLIILGLGIKKNIDRAILR